MKIYQCLDDYEFQENAVVTVGTFDGVHMGHQMIFHRMKEIAEAVSGPTVVVTFHPHPRLVVHSDNRNLKFINTREKKYDRIAAAGIDSLIIINFTPEFSRLSSEEFVKQVLVDKIGLRHLVVGYDHHFGKNREGGYKSLKTLAGKYNFSIQEVPAKYIHNIAVSSTQIRNALRLGEVSLANELLGYEYSITGKVMRGKRIGHEIGFPTANIEMEDEYKLITAVGVYACRINYKGDMYNGMGNIGYRPTVDDGNFTIEVNIFNFDREIYGEYLTIYFLERIRDEIKFRDLKTLRKQLVRDRKKVVRLLG